MWNQTFLSLLARSIGEKNDEAPSSFRVTSENKTIYSPLPQLPTIEGCDVWYLLLWKRLFKLEAKTPNLLTAF